MKEAKKLALKELEGLKKSLKGVNPDLDAIETHLNSLPLFHRVIYRSDKKGELEIYYGSMTLKIFINCGIININEHLELWNGDGQGFLGTFTPKTLGMECSGELD